MLALLQAGHHGLHGDGAKLVGEGAVEDQNVHGEDPLADGCGMLQDEALVDKENTTWGKVAAKESRAVQKPEDYSQRASQSPAWTQTSIRTGQMTGFQLAKDTKNQGHQRTQGERHPEMGHPVVQRGHGHAVGEDTLQANEQQPSWERHAGPHVVERLSVVDLTHRSSQTGCEQKRRALGRRARSPGSFPP